MPWRPWWPPRRCPRRRQLIGSRGSGHIREILPVPNMEVAAVVDPDGRRTETAANLIFQKTGKRPSSVSRIVPPASAVASPSIPTCFHIRMPAS